MDPMKRVNIVIIALFTCGLIGLILIELGIAPGVESREQQLAKEQRLPKTHHIEEVLKYRHDNMGNAANITRLNSELPLGYVDRTYSLDSERLAINIKFASDAASIGQELVEQALLYNSTANFALIGNLQTIRYQFENAAYTVERRQIEALYGKELWRLLEGNRWSEDVQRQLSDTEFIHQFLDSLSTAK
ncbi:DUF4825 domain-containing protein [Paenibacillus sp. GCM10027626]|uniref:DUF4825 domain-containing protein n=1 Tax=Paenibacillus sp. GCM10027626 TaxID=3273411 RepID=UPI00363527A6